jgi:hypothetical protein
MVNELRFIPLSRIYTKIPGFVTGNKKATPGKGVDFLLLLVITLLPGLQRDRHSRKHRTRYIRPR